MKWSMIDGIFLFSTQALWIPWPEWIGPTILSVFLIHILGNGFLMFRIPVRTVPSFPFNQIECLVNLGADPSGHMAFKGYKTGSREGAVCF